MPLADTLPGDAARGPVRRSSCARSFDEVLAPVLLSLDAFAAYLDPATAPEDMLAWLATWLGHDASTRTPTCRAQRELLQAAG